MKRIYIPLRNLELRDEQGGIISQLTAQGLSTIKISGRIITVGKEISYSNIEEVMKEYEIEDCKYQIYDPKGAVEAAKSLVNTPIYFMHETIPTGEKVYVIEKGRKKLVDEEIPKVCGFWTESNYIPPAGDEPGYIEASGTILAQLLQKKDIERINRNVGNGQLCFSQEAISSFDEGDYKVEQNTQGETVVRSYKWTYKDGGGAAIVMGDETMPADLDTKYTYLLQAATARMGDSLPFMDILELTREQATILTDDYQIKTGTYQFQLKEQNEISFLLGKDTILDSDWEIIGVEIPREKGKVLKSKDRKELSDADYAVVITVKNKKTGKTRKIRKYPINDEGHVKSALGRIADEENRKALKKLGVSPVSVERKIKKRARRFGMKIKQKSVVLLKEKSLMADEIEEMLRKAINESFGYVEPCEGNWWPKNNPWVRDWDPVNNLVFVGQNNKIWQVPFEFEEDDTEIKLKMEEKEEVIYRDSFVKVSESLTESSTKGGGRDMTKDELIKEFPWMATFGEFKTQVEAAIAKFTPPEKKPETATGDPTKPVLVTGIAEPIAKLRFQDLDTVLPYTRNEKGELKDDGVIAFEFCKTALDPEYAAAYGRRKELAILKKTEKAETVDPAKVTETPKVDDPAKTTDPAKVTDPPPAKVDDPAKTTEKSTGNPGIAAVVEDPEIGAMTLDQLRDFVVI